MAIREARIMNIRQFRTEFMTVRDPIIVLSGAKVIGSWTPGTENIDPVTLAQAMGLVATVSTAAERFDRQPVHPVPKPGTKQR
jgi:hypothetical protein